MHIADTLTMRMRMPMPAADADADADADASCMFMLMHTCSCAGEFGAQRIYDGQLAILRGTKSAPVISEMREQERVHLREIEAIMPQKRARPTVLLPIVSGSDTPAHVI